MNASALESYPRWHGYSRHGLVNSHGAEFLQYPMWARTTRKPVVILSSLNLSCRSSTLASTQLASHPLSFVPPWPSYLSGHFFSARSYVLLPWPLLSARILTSHLFPEPSLLALVILRHHVRTVLVVVATASADIRQTSAAPDAHLTVMPKPRVASTALLDSRPALSMSAALSLGASRNEPSSSNTEGHMLTSLLDSVVVPPTFAIPDVRRAMARVVTRPSRPAQVLV